MANSIDTLKSWRKDAKSNRKTFKKRRDAVQKAYDKGYNYDDYYTKIKKKVEDCTSELSNGIKGISIVSTKCEYIDDHRDKQALSDFSDFSSALTSMRNEINRCQDKMDYYDWKIDDYERQIKEQGGVILPWE